MSKPKHRLNLKVKISLIIFFVIIYPGILYFVNRIVDLPFYTLLPVFIGIFFLSSLATAIRVDAASHKLESLDEMDHGHKAITGIGMKYKE
ncbi:hypothetical protein PASE110613_10870 [Paenibacillus sediminis]|uniref:Uncharacterized protein n=1 Tax=Paenibacillus sediminis TaxID=664909 RepID=A0ABS4H4J7_9BACL|nr:hypothetical protein [Paenibacillus sediminis]MBP1937457.1 hypothetical protein [Paenibacillus sediminis]